MTSHRSMRKADKYRNFRELSAREQRGVDFDIHLSRRSAPVAIVAPHGGKIEKGTSEIAEAIAGGTYNLYCFEGMKPRRNWDLHITSRHFDEPECLDLISTCDLVVTVHGCNGANQTIYLGGLDEALHDAIRSKLNDVGFSTAIHPNLDGQSPANICNRGRQGQGVQLEISKGLRRVLVQPNPTEGPRILSGLASAVRSAIDETLG